MDWINTGILLVLYLALGMVCAIVREFYLGCRAEEQDPEMFFGLVAFWPLILPALWLYGLGKWAWGVGFNRNLPPANQHPTAKRRK